MSEKRDPERVVREIKRKTRRKFSAEEKIRIVLEGLRGEDSVAGLCRREGISPNLYYNWSKEFLEAGQRRLQTVNGIGHWSPKFSASLQYALGRGVARVRCPDARREAGRCSCPSAVTVPWSSSRPPRVPIPHR